MRMPVGAACSHFPSRARIPAVDTRSEPGRYSDPHRVAPHPVVYQRLEVAIPDPRPCGQPTALRVERAQWAKAQHPGSRGPSRRQKAVAAVIPSNCQQAVMDAVGMREREHARRRH
jgi:hypothetical protein